LIGSATVVAATAEVHSFTDINKLIPDGNLAGLSDSRSVTSTVLQITSLRVHLQVAGEFNGDLYGYLRHVDGGRTNLCVLLNRPGRNGGNAAGYADAGLDVVFEDAASGDIHSYRAATIPAPGNPLTGTWQPDGRNLDPMVVLESSVRSTGLGAFAGANPNGAWTVYLADTESGGTNLLRSWSLEFNGPTAAPVSWPAPADIVYGTALSPAQLNASSSVPGTFNYTPSAGTMLNAGAGQTLSVTFTPLDTANYLPVTTSVSISVLKKDLTITADNKAQIYGAALPGLTVNCTGFVNGDTEATLDAPVNLSTTATPACDAGLYPITPSAASDANYSITFVPGTLTVSPASTAGILVSSANPALPGAPVSFTYTLAAIPPGSGTPVGNVQFRVDGASAGAPVPLTGGAAVYTTSVLPVGLHAVAAEFAGSLNFLGTTTALPAAQLINTPPLAGADTIERWPTTGTKVAISALLANDTDADGDPVTWLGCDSTSVNGGTITQQNGWLFYTPAAGFTNSDSFSYSITDSRGIPVLASVTVAIKQDLFPSPNLNMVDLGNGTFRLWFDGVPGATYRIQYSASMAAPDWLTLGSNTANASGVFLLTDTPPAGTLDRYYRSVYP
jgi:subtilisin-like proprotein convertase family protein